MDLIIIEDKEIIPIIYNGKRVLTFRQIDMLHGRAEGTSRKRFADNRKHFVEKEDFYILHKPDIIALSEKRTDININASKLALVTESGYLNLVKSFNDDLAWKVQKALIKNYFRLSSKNDNLITIDPSKNQPDLILYTYNLSKQLEEAKPKIKFFDRAINASGMLDFSKAAKTLGYGKNTMLKMLRKKKILRYNNEPYQSYIDRGYFEMKERTYLDKKKKEDVVYSKPFVTSKGLVWLEKILKEQIAS